MQSGIPDWVSDAPDAATAAFLKSQLADEHILEVLEVSGPKPPKKRWLVITTARLLVVADQWIHDLTGKLPPATSGVATIDYQFGGETQFQVMVIHRSDVDRLIALTESTLIDRVLKVSARLQKKSLYADAAEFLADVVHLFDIEARNPAYPTEWERVQLDRAHCAFRMSATPLGISLLTGLAQRRDADLIEFSESRERPRDWWVGLAIAFEENGKHELSTKVYSRLVEDAPQLEVLKLAQARSAARAGDVDTALQAYETFIREWVVGDKPALIHVHQDADPDFVAACLESGELLESEGRAKDAAIRYRTLICNAPLAEEGYQRLFALRDKLDDDFVVERAARVLNTVDPSLAARLNAPVHPRPAAEQWFPVVDETHDKVVVHPDERAVSSTTQRWVGLAFKDERNTKDIERHCEQVTAEQYPDVFKSVNGLSAALCIKPPRVFISHGLPGIEVLGQQDPFILIGRVHLDPQSELLLNSKELRFAIGTQLEHIRADHLLLTSSEFWRAFGSRSIMTVLTLLPMGELVSKVTDGPLSKFLSKFKTGVEAKALQKVLSLAETRVQDGATSSGVQSAYEATLSTIATKTGGEPEAESLAKEKLADFARAARYTADRFGLAAAASVSNATSAMIKLSAHASSEIGRLETEGLRAVLEATDDDGQLLYPELVLRCDELLKFALSDAYRDLHQELYRQ